MAPGHETSSEPYDIRLFTRTGKIISIRARPEKIFEEGRLVKIKCQFTLLP